MKLFGRRKIAPKAEVFELTDGTALQKASGSSAYSGKAVTVDSALQLATVWACVRLISETIATLPLGVYRKDAIGKKELAKDHPLYALLHDQPNYDMTAVEFWEAMVAGIALRGNAYALKEMGASGRLVALSPLRNDLMTVKRKDNGELVYSYADPKARKDYNQREIFHLKGFGVDGIVGLSPVTMARNSFGAAMAADEAAGAVFKNGLFTGGALSVDKVLTPEQRELIRTSLADTLAGTANSGRVIVLEGGMTYQQTSMNPEDVQMLQTRGFHVEEICRWFRTPPFMIGHTEKVTSWGTGLEQQMIGFLTFTLRPYLSRIEQGIKRSLLKPEERGTIWAEFNLEGLLRADSTARANLYASAAQNGWMSRNEIRELENRPSRPEGDELTVQSNLLPLGKLGQQTAARPAQSDTTEQ